MKKLAAAAMALMPLAAYALGDPEKCAALGAAWPMAIAAHNQGLTPEEAFKVVAQYRALSEQEVKSVVNEVYFNPQLIGVSGADLQAAASKRCYYEKQPTKPLK